MEPIIEKIDEQNIKVIIKIESTQESVYTYEMLVLKKQELENQKVKEAEAIDKEIKAVENLIAECEKLGVGQETS